MNFIYARYCRCLLINVDELSINVSKIKNSEENNVENSLSLYHNIEKQLDFTNFEKSIESQSSPQIGVFMKRILLRVARLVDD